MAIKIDRANHIIKEEIMIAIKNNPELGDKLTEGIFSDMLLKGGKAIGVALLQQMLSTSSGRNNLADILEALPEFIKTHICDLAHVLREEFKLEGTGSRMVAKSISLVCRGWTSISFGIFYAVAFILRKLSDKSAQRIIQEAGKVQPSKKQDNPVGGQNDAPGEDGLPRSEAAPPDPSSPTSNDTDDWEEIPGFGKVAERNNTLKYLRIIRENELLRK